VASFDFDIIVVGAGHAGIEACLATSGLGLRTLMVTSNLQRIGYMSCNPSIGGLGKGHMVRELDVLGGFMGFVADKTCIQFKRLNSRKGPAVRGSRTQNDKELYSQTMQQRLQSQPHLSLKGGEVKKLILEGSICRGVVLDDGSEIRSARVIITAGTFLNGVMHMGLEQTPGGRVGDKAAVGLSDQLKEFGFEVRRLKTGTPARLVKESIDWDKTIPQYGDEKQYPFSLRSEPRFSLPQVPCFLSRTTAETHEIIRKNLHLSPMYCGVIEGTGPRYCPSIEDKIVRFGDREGHQTFLEPESLSTNLIYLQGISTSLPKDVQDQFLKTIPGLENVEVARYGYAVEYDFIEPTQIWHRLETRPVQNLFLAGQINGTSGYEEAAAQGFVAGINAAHSFLGREEFVLGRDEAYIGVLIDDLVTKGTREPYRMFTSRAEHRLILREDNALDRLSEISLRLGLLDSKLVEKLADVRFRRNELAERLRTQRLTPSSENAAIIAEMGTPPLTRSVTYEEFLRRTEIESSQLQKLGFAMDEDPLISEPVEIEVKYSGYVRRQMEIIEQIKKYEEQRIPDWLDYGRVKGLSNEEIEKLRRVKPRTLGQAGRISGVNPSAVQALMIFLKTNVKRQEAASESMGQSPR
jgi:tRNA uridine 5-carboxymethylaminomethyl modification enzyme